ncbi:hypothetical protein WMY93_020830 [Mugilogobius chulae]|uniref:ribonuclease H n=1 Tax=Mugilogobius chulae TaxID=88201 RepID=A0AAW0NA42_9GOBI
MLESLSCKSCLAPLQPDDGHDLCPACLGVDHLREGLSDNPCMNCTIMPRSVRSARLAAFVDPEGGLSGPQSDHTQVEQSAGRKREGERTSSLPRKRTKKVKHSEAGLTGMVDSLWSEVAQVKTILQSLQVARDNQGVGSFSQDDALSVAASDSQFQEIEDHAENSGSLFGETSQDSIEASETVSRASTYSDGESEGSGSAVSAIRTALARLHLDVQPVQPMVTSAFFRRQGATASFLVPPSEDYLKELHACWADARLFSRPTADGRALASMQNAPQFGLGHMPSVEPTVASLIVPPDEALRTNARCPRPQCRVTDELLCRAYDAGARMGRTGNSLSHLLLALASSLEASGVDSSTQALVDTSLQAFAFMSRELGRLLSILTQTRRQVCAQHKPLKQDNSWPAFIVRPLQGLLLQLHVGPTRLSQPRLQFLAVHRDLDPFVGSTQGPNLCTVPAQHGRTGLLLGPPRAEEAASEALRPAVGYFTPAQLSYWAAHTPDVWVLTTLSRGYRLQFRRRPPVFGRVRMTIIQDPAKALALDQEISTLLVKGAIVPVNPRLDPGGFYSRYFLVPKKTGDLRPVLDLRGLNVFLKVMPFRMLRTAEVLQAISAGEWFTTLDLKDAYFHVPIARPHWKFLRFAFQGRHFEFRVLPFGLSLSPRVFTRVVAAALSPLQAQGLKIMPYLDDWLICASTREQAIRDTQTVLIHLQRLGLRVNLAKSNVNPSQDTVFLGMALNTATMTACPSPRRVDDILELLSRFREGSTLPYVLYLRLLGKLVAAASVVPLGLLSLRPMQMWLNDLHLDPSRLAHRHRMVRVSAQCLMSLTPWRDRHWIVRGVPLGSLPSRREVVYTDASSTGWGATWQGQMVQGTWSPHLQGEHINVLELLAVHLALRHLLQGLRGRHVLVRSDNTSVVYHINHMGGTSNETGQFESCPSSGSAERGGRFSFSPDSEARRMDAPPGGGGEHLAELWKGTGRSFCLPRGSPLPPVVLSGRSLQSPGPRRLGTRLAPGSPICFPSIQPDPCHSYEGPSGGSQSPPGRPVLASEDMVSSAAETLLQLANAPSSEIRSPVPVERTNTSPRSQSPSALGLATPGPVVGLSHFDDDVAHTIRNARAPSTRVQYANRWRLFTNWCRDNGQDPECCPVSSILSFLQGLLNNRRSPSTLKVYVAAISCWHKGFDGVSLGRHKSISLFLKGARRLHPPQRHVAPTWDLSLVLDALQSPPFEPLPDVDIKWLSMKTAFLLAMASARRVGELQALSVHESCCRWNSDGSGVTLWPDPSFVPKVPSSSACCPPLQLARFDTEGSSPHLCPVRALNAYIQVTASFRQSDCLFVCFAGSRKGQALSKQRLAHWVVDVISKAYSLRSRPLPAGVRCHSTRGVTTSWAAMNGVPLDVICAAAAWTSPSTFTRFYQVNMAHAHPLDGVLRQHRPSS